MHPVIGFELSSMSQKDNVSILYKLKQRKSSQIVLSKLLKPKHTILISLDPIVILFRQAKNLNADL